MSENGEKQVLLGMSADNIAKLPFCEGFRARQIYGGLMDGRSFDEMTSLPKELRARLSEEYISSPVEILRVFKGRSGTKKYLYRLLDGGLIEGVYMPHDYGDTLCISTQIGCRMDCKFCASGLDGLLRNLAPAEMLGEVICANRENGGTAKKRAVTNIVLMGSGEPFDNYDNVLAFLDAVSAEGGINISERNISLSTSGIAPKIRQFATSGHKVTLSISLHAPFDALRSSLMPINKAYPIAEVISAARYYFEKTGRRVIFEYTLIKGKNDSDACAKELARITRGFPSHVNLIRLNEVKESMLKAPENDATEAFKDKLEELGVSTTIRRSLGGDIEGACGQLRRRYIEENGEGDGN